MLHACSKIAAVLQNASRLWHANSMQQSCCNLASLGGSYGGRGRVHFTEGGSRKIHALPRLGAGGRRRRPARQDCRS
ncbi:hypothetical protein XACJJ10_2560009 [Xanthomonas citri pv. citri]|nr:hypothetical protein XACJJ10_2560009 [Xanthomonas citri pv. citri]